MFRAQYVDHQTHLPTVLLYRVFAERQNCLTLLPSSADKMKSGVVADMQRIMNTHVH
jgi:hypothetical protein